MKLPKVGKSTSSETQGFLVLDINTTSVKAMALINEDKKMVVKGASKRDTYEADLRPEVVQNVVDDCILQSGFTPAAAIVGLSGPNVQGFLLIAKITRDKPDKQISEKEMDKVYSKVREASYTQAKQRWSTYFADEVDFEPLDLVVTSVYVDENQFEDAVGQTGKEIKVTVFCSYSEREYYKWAMGFVDDLGFTDVTVTTTTYSQSKLLAEHYKNFILVDIGKEHTDVAIVFGKNIVQTRSFGMGGAYFAEYLADKMGLDFTSANGKKEGYSMGTLPEDEADKVGDFLYEAGKYWRSAFSTVLSSMTGIKSFPKHVVISGGGSGLSIIQELLYEDEWRKPIAFSGDIEIESPKAEYWKKYVDDELNVLVGPQMFVPATLAVVEFELEEDDE